jgi:hypothetical protein
MFNLEESDSSKTHYKKRTSEIQKDTKPATDEIILSYKNVDFANKKIDKYVVYSVSDGEIKGFSIKLNIFKTIESSKKSKGK